MVSSIQQRLMVASGVGWLVLGGALACGTTGSHTTAAPTVATSLTEVRVDQEEAATVISLPGISPRQHVAYEQSDPQRLVVDLVAVQPQLDFETLEVGDGLVEQVTVRPLTSGGQETGTRLEVLLSARADHDVVVFEDGVEIWLIDADAPGAPDVPDAISALIDARDQQRWPKIEAREATRWSGADAKAASQLLAVDVQREGESTVVQILADGRIDGADSFVLEDPDRLVVDLPVLSTEVGSQSIAAGTPHASRVRLGLHPDKIRLVVDAGSAGKAFGDHRIEATDTGLRIVLGAGSGEVTLAAAKPAATPEPLLAKIDVEETASGASAQAAPQEIEGGEVLATAEVPTPEPAPAPALLAAAAPEPIVLPAAAPDALFIAPASPEAPAVATEEVHAAAEPTPEPAAAAPQTRPEEPAGEPTVAIAPAAPTPAAQPVEPGAARIVSVQLDPQSDGDRVVVVADSPLDYQLVEVDSDTLIVRLPGSTLGPDAEVRMVPDVPGPVSMVSSFQQPEMSVPEARLVVRRAAGLEPTVTQVGTTLLLDFERQERVAAPLPLQTAAAQILNPPPPASRATTQRLPSAAVAPAGPPAVEVDPASLDDGAIDLLREGGFGDLKQYVGRRISLDFKDADINDVLRLIAEVSDLNVISGDDVQGKVTIRLVDVPWDQALDVVLLSKGLGFERVGNVLRIAPSGLLKSESEARLQERRAKEKLEDLVVKMQPVNYAEAKEMQKLVKRLLTARGTVDIDQRTNTLIIKDIPSVIDEATALVKAIDTQTPQVLIEARIVEANLDFTRELGSTWSLGVNPNVDPFDDGSAVDRTHGSEDVRFHDENNVVFTNPIGGSTGLVNLAAFLLDETFDLNVTLQAAETSGEGKVISSPRIVTLDNTLAKIEQGVSIPFQTFENGDAQLEFIDAVLSLSVTPHVTADRSIIMKLLVSRNAPDASVATTNGTPGIAKNQAETEALVKDGQTLVIGGIYVVDKSNAQTRVPYLHKIPILGAMFRNNRVFDNRDELLIFVTPRIVHNPDLAG